jgi:hypothetical protein
MNRRNLQKFCSLGLLVLGATFAFAADAPPAAAAESRSAALSVSKSKVDTDSYTVEIKAGSNYKVGTQGAVEIVLVPKGSYHVNEKFLHKFKASDAPPEGLKYPKPTLAKEDGRFSSTRGSFSLPFVAAKAGKQKVGGWFIFSVCSDTNCVMDKVELDVMVDVK